MEKRVCPNCGNEIQENDKFCDNCGAQIPEKKKKNFKMIGLGIACVLVLVVGIGIFGGESTEPLNLKADELSDIMFDDDKAEEYLDTPINTTGYLFREDDVIDGNNKLTDSNYVFCSSVKRFTKGKIVLFESDHMNKLKNVGTLSKLSMNGQLVKHKSGMIFFNVDKISIEKKLTKEEGKTALYKKLGIDENEIQKADSSTEESNDVKDGDTITVDDLLADPTKYAGKTLRIKGKFPQALARSSDGRDIVAINNDNLDQYVEIKGGSPNFGGCEGIVTGNIILNNGTPIINATSFESINETYSAVGTADYYPITDGYTGYTDTYVANYNMAIRDDYSTTATKVDTLKKGQYVEIRDIKGGLGSETWGLIQHGKWVCIHGENPDEEYLTNLSGD